jgi:hypothetical protein
MMFGANSQHLRVAPGATLFLAGHAAIVGNYRIALRAHAVPAASHGVLAIAFVQSISPEQLVCLLVYYAGDDNG